MKPTASAGPASGRVTRSRAAALRASGERIPSEAFRTSKHREQKHAPQAKSKRMISDENGDAANIAGIKRNKKVALQDVTNVCCENLCRDCFNATKVLANCQANNGKKAGKAPVKDPKVIKSVSVEILKPQSDLGTKIASESVKAEPSLKKSSKTIKLEKDVSSRLCSTECTRSNSQLTEESSGASSQKQALKRSPHRTLETSNDLGFIDIDSDKDPQLCGLYAPEIFRNLHFMESLRRPCDYMETVQKDITRSMRGILVDWLVEVSEEYRLVPDTLYLTVNLIDWYLSENPIERRRLQLLGITCMLIASKYEEICAPSVQEFCFITDNTYTREEVLKMEGQLVNYFGFQLFVPTTKTFLRRFLRAAQACYTNPSHELEYLADYLVELTLVEYDFWNFLPSLIAASAVFLARWMLDHSHHPWNQTLEFYTSYKALDLKDTVLALQDLQLNAKGCPLNAIRSKYRQQKFKVVALLSSPKVLETLF